MYLFSQHLFSPLILPDFEELSIENMLELIYFFWKEVHFLFENIPDVHLCVYLKLYKHMYRCMMVYFFCSLLNYNSFKYLICIGIKILYAHKTSY